MNTKKFLASAAATSLLFLSLAVPALAANNGNNANGNSQHYGPFASTSPDSSTCGGNWATDTFNREFRVDTTPVSTGTYNVVEDFKDGSFVTVAGNSPGGCDTNPGGTIVAGVTGSMQGSFNIVVTGGKYDPTAVCTVSKCGTTASFVKTVFGASATYDVPTFDFHYSAGAQNLSFHDWKNASADRGGNQGDIAN